MFPCSVLRACWFCCSTLLLLLLLSTSLPEERCAEARRNPRTVIPGVGGGKDEVPGGESHLPPPRQVQDGANI